MRILKRKATAFSKRALSVFLALLMFLTAFTGTLAGVFVTLAGNPSTVKALNRSYVVQNINLLPVDPTATNTRTTLKAGTTGKESYKYAEVTVNEDETVDFRITADNWHSNSSHASDTTSYVENFTIIGQKINLAENPWLMVRWSGSGRCNGRVYFTITKDGVEYGAKGKVISNASTANPYDFTSDATTLATSFLSSSNEKKPFSLPLSNIINDNEAGYKFTNQTQTDFNAGVLHDYTIDFYKYVKENYASYFPSGDQWKDSSKNYITIYMSACIIASEAGNPLTSGTSVKWDRFAIGREVMNRPASLLPRSVEYMNVLDSSSDTAVTHGRVSSSDDGSVTFLNTSSTSSVRFKWNLRRYFNATELEALNMDFLYSGMTSGSALSMTTEFGGRTVTYLEPGNYNYRGCVPSFQTLFNNYARSKKDTPIDGGGRYEAVIDFNKFLMDQNTVLESDPLYTGSYKQFFPDDSLIYIGDVNLTVPAGAKITFTKLEFQVENEEIPATESNTVYPWASAQAPNGLPPEGTPAYSTALNGATGISYDWATDASDAPLVKTKVDMLAMKTYSYHDWTDKAISTATDTTDVSYTRKSDGSSIYTSTGQTDHTYYQLMRWGNTEDSSKWNRNFYTYLDVTAQYHAPKYLYYSYELEDTNTSDGQEPSAGLYFHFQNARRDRYVKKGEDGTTVTDMPYSYQYYLDHSGIGLNECSSMFYLGYTGTKQDLEEYKYGAEAILSTKNVRTGVLDVRSLWVDGLSNASDIPNGRYLKLESLRVYLGPNTKIKINYLFFGSESLDESARGQVANEGGDAVPWSVSKADFDACTEPDSSSKRFTYANKLDLFEDIKSRAIINGRTGYPGATVNADSSVTLNVTNTSNFNSGYYAEAGFGFDHIWRVNVAQSGDKSSMRYLNYSVSAPQGMRWSIMFNESNNSTTQQRAIMTWCDSDAAYNEPSSGYDINTSAPAGKSYFRYVSTGTYKGQNPVAGAKPEYENYWQGHNNDSWRLYSIPGSQSGCIDLRQMEEYFEWNNIISIYLVAYRDPRLVLDAGETASVTFNYLYLTSTPVSISSGSNPVGKPAVTSGTIYDWGNTKVTAPSVSSSTKVDFTTGAAPYTEIWDTTTHVNYYAKGTVDHFKAARENSTVEVIDDSGTGTHSIDALNRLKITSSGQYRLTYNISSYFNLSTYNDLQFEINSSASFKIALEIYDSAGKNTWVNFPDTLTDGCGFTNTTVNNNARIKAGYYKFSVNLSNYVSTSNSAMNQSSVRFSQLIILFNSEGAANAWMNARMLNFDLNPTVNLQTSPYLYYSYRFIDKSTGKAVNTITENGVIKTQPFRVGMRIFNGGHYYTRTMGGADSASDPNSQNTAVGYEHGYNAGYGKPSFIRLSSSDNAGQGYDRKQFYTYGVETGCIDLRQYFTDHDTSVTLSMIRFIVDSPYYTNTDRYEFVVDYMFLGGASTTTTTMSTSGYVPLKSAPTPADFHDKVLADGTAVSSGSTATSGIVVNLDETPYLFYSANLAAGAKGTFALQTNVTAAGSKNFYRDANRADGYLISAGTPSSVNYMPQSESGCIDVRDWYRKNGYTGSTVTINSVRVYGTKITFNYLYFGAKSDKTIDLIPDKASGDLDNGLATRTWVNPLSKHNELGETINSTREVIDKSNPLYDPSKDPNPSATYAPYSPVPENNKQYPTTEVTYKDDVTGDGYNDLWIRNNEWSQVYLRYGNITSTGTSGTFAYCTTGNNQMSGLMVDLNETPYLHFSFEQPETSRMSMVIQAKYNTAAKELSGKPANEVRPWLSGYCPTSPAGQLICIVSDSTNISYYKDLVMDKTTYVSGNQGGVIDLRSWFSITNGYSNTISIDSIRFYTHNADETYTTGTDLKINHLYLSTSASAAYSVTFHTNKNDGNDRSYTQYVLKNANQQLVSDAAVADFKIRSGYSFVGWYTDPECTDYFDINGTPLTKDTNLYARWIADSDVVSDSTTKEVNMLSYMDKSAAESTGTGNVEFDDEAVTINNTGSVPFEITFPIHRVYHIKQLRSLFVGFDIDKTNGGYTTTGDYTGFDIVVNAQSVNPQAYALVGNAFSLDFLTDNGILTAAPYDRECGLYTYLGVRDELPTVENTDNLFEVDSITIKVPVGVSSEIRYIKAANEMSLQGNLDTCAPLSKTSTFDLLANTKKDPAFVRTYGDIVYDELETKSITYDDSASFTQASIHGITDGYAHLGGLYNFTINMLDSVKDTLYIQVDQPLDSNFTFAIYASFDGVVEGETGAQTDYVYDIYTPKSVSVYSPALNALVEKDYNTDVTSYIPADELYFQGKRTIKINLHDWYANALSPYRSNNTIHSVKVLGVRFFTDNASTDATVDYMFIGGEEHGDSAAEFTCFMEYPYKQGHAGQEYNPTSYAQHRYIYGTEYRRGETLYVSLEDLKNIPSGVSIYNDPTKKFLGWVFSDIALGAGYTEEQLKDHLVWWNPDATNGNMYSSSNTGGAWSLNYVSGFIQNQKSVFFNFTTHNGNTQVIAPVFATDTYTPTVKATVSGSGSVSVISGNTTAVSGQANTWTVPFGTSVALRATGSNFQGWYDDDVLVSKAADYYLYVTQDVDVTARFGTTAPADTQLLYTPQSGRSIVWLQSETGTAATDFKLQSVSGGDIVYYEVGDTTLGHLAKSNIADTTGNKQIACYWNMKDSQILRAVAPSGYHWEHRLSDGTQVQVSESNVYEFIASTNIRLVAVADASQSDTEGAIVIDEFVFDDQRSDPLLRINGQVLCADDEEVVSCGMVFTDYKGHGELPHYNCDASQAVTAKAWNSSTGQFVVEFSVENAPEYVIRGFAIIRKAGTNNYEIRYSDTVTTVF